MVDVEKFKALLNGDNSIRPGPAPVFSTWIKSKPDGGNEEQVTDEDTFGAVGFEIVVPEDYKRTKFGGLDKVLLLALVKEFRAERSADTVDLQRPPDDGKQQFVPPLKIRLGDRKRRTVDDGAVEIEIAHDVESSIGPSFKRLCLSPTRDLEQGTPAPVQKKKKVRSASTERLAESESVRTEDGLSQKKKEELRLMAKKLSKDLGKLNFGKLAKKAVATTKMPILKRNSDDRRADAGTKEIFVRHSILDKPQKSTPHSDLGRLFGLGESSRVVVTPTGRRPDPESGRLHSYASHFGRFGKQVRLRPAMYVPLLPPDDVLDILNNLTAKVTKAVRQNGGFVDIKPTFTLDQEEPRFANRVPFRLFKVPGRYFDGGATVEDQMWDSQRRSAACRRKKSLASVLDAELRALDVGRTLADDVVIVTKNSAHLYLFGVNSEYGDTANLESDMCCGRVTPSPVWINPKPYVQMVINGLKSRGMPHITAEPPAVCEEAMEGGQAMECGGPSPI